MPTERLSQVLFGACREHPERVAVVGETTLSYRDLEARVRATARLLHPLLDTGSGRVGIHARNSVDYLVAYYAVVHLGCVPFLIDAQFGATELEGIWSTCGVDTFLVDGDGGKFPLPGKRQELPEQAMTLVAVGDSGMGSPPALDHDTVTCRFTSGTTGAPKCLEFSHEAVLNAARSWHSGTGLVADDRTLCLAAFTNGLAFNTSLLSTFLAGAQLHLYDGLPTSSRVRQAVGRARATRLVAFPLVYQLLAEANECGDGVTGSLRLAISAAAALDQPIRTRFEDRYQVRIANYYGIAEVGPCTFEPDAGYRRGLGMPLPGVVLRTGGDAQDRQEVLARTRSMATRYLNAPGLLESRLDGDGFYRSGDTGYVADGRLFLTGRLAGPINLAGRKIDPAEIEQVVRGMPGVVDAVVLADLDANGATVLHLAASAEPGHTPGRAEVVRTCRERLAAYKVPARITFVPEIPRSAAGKLRLTALRQLVTDHRRGDDDDQ